MHRSSDMASVIGQGPDTGLQCMYVPFFDVTSRPSPPS
jgi:hypothetical protein